MKIYHAFVLSVMASTVLLFTTLAAGCNQHTTSTSAAAQPQSSRLGDLSAFQLIARDVQALVARGDLAQAKARIQDLELAWDAAEAGLKPRAADDWHQLDHLIDQALSALRADSPTQGTCQSAVQQLLQGMALLGKQP